MRFTVLIVQTRGAVIDRILKGFVVNCGHFTLRTDDGAAVIYIINYIPGFFFYISTVGVPRLFGNIGGRIVSVIEIPQTTCNAEVDLAVTHNIMPAYADFLKRSDGICIATKHEQRLNTSIVVFGSVFQNGVIVF